MEENDKTQIDKTQIEDERTQIESKGPPTEEKAVLTTFKGWNVVKELPAIGGEADAFLIEKAGITHFLKLYRKGVNPKVEVLQKVKELSEKIPEHVVRVYSVGFDDETGRYYEVMEYARYGNLREAYEKYDLKIEDIVKELGEAIHYLHRHNIIHRDIKPTNILVREIEPLDLILTDFGISSAVMEDVSKVLTTVKGTFQYSAPETFSGYFGKEIDWWSLGMIVYELLTGSNPFRGLSQQVIMNKLITENVPIPKNIDERYQLLLKGLLTRDPKKRWKWEEVERWLKGEKDIKVYYGEPVERREYSEDEWQRQGFTPQGAQKWKETGLSPAKARAFRNAGFTPVEAKEWVQVGIKNATTAKGWRNTGISPYEAYKFDSYGLGYELVKRLLKTYPSVSTVELIEVLELFGDYESARSFMNEYFESWKKEGFSPEEAKQWIDSGLSPDESIKWKKHGFTFEEVKVLNRTINRELSTIWYVQSGKLLNTLQGHKNSVNSVSWSPDGKHIASGSENGAVRICSVQKRH